MHSYVKIITEADNHILSIASEQMKWLAELLEILLQWKQMFFENI